MALFAGVAEALQAHFGAVEVDYSDVRKQRNFPKKIQFKPEACFKSGSIYYLTHILSAPVLPDWLLKATKELRKVKQYKVIVIANTILNSAADESDTTGRMEEVKSSKVAAGVVDDCAKQKVGLLVQLGKAYALILNGKTPRTSSAKPQPMEFGHIPKWTLQLLSGLPRASKNTQKCFDKFIVTYTKATKKKIAYEDECDLLIDVAKQIHKGDRRLHCPIGKLVVLKEWELGNANPKSRDHFFHTFNNLFVGFAILGRILPNNRAQAAPECYLREGSSLIKAEHWESLWLLTCLFHDPGYLAEHYWSTHSFSMGLEGPSGEIPVLPEKIVDSINNAWETEYKEPRGDLADLFYTVSRIWLPGTFSAGRKNEFDAALRKAYFNGVKCGHSVMSGLALIMACKSPRAVMPDQYNEKLSLTAATIAALGMLFHDPGCRSKLESNGVLPIPFECLPYASVLMFSDAIQDDRRDINVAQFAAKEVVKDFFINLDKNEIRVIVDLTKLPKTWWAFKIAEYESVMKWINDSSQTKFFVDYEKSIGLAA